MQSLFYFNDVSQLTDFKEEKSEGIQGRQFPVADLYSESCAELFASLCQHFIGKA